VKEDFFSIRRSSGSKSAGSVRTIREHLVTDLVVPESLISELNHRLWADLDRRDRHDVIEYAHRFHSYHRGLRRL
jgi:hypothetical protein